MINKKDDPRNAMKIPDGFLENFEDHLISNIDLEKKTIELRWQKRLWSVAASVMLALAILFVVRYHNNEAQTDNFAELSIEENWQYLLENANELNFEDFYSFEETGASIYELQSEIFGDASEEHILEEIDLETLEMLYE